MNDMTDPSVVPQPVRREVFTAAMIALRQALLEHGYSLDAIAELELLDQLLQETHDRLDVPERMN